MSKIKKLLEDKFLIVEEILQSKLKFTQKILAPNPYVPQEHQQGLMKLTKKEI